MRPLASSALIATSIERAARHGAEQEPERRRARQHASRRDLRDRQGRVDDILAADLIRRQRVRRLLKGAAGRGDGQLVGLHARPDIGQRILAEAVPLHAELAAGLARGFDEAHFEHDLLRLQHLHGVDDIRRELSGDDHRLVQGRRIVR
jgi:hypothetical protein